MFAKEIIFGGSFPKYVGIPSSKLPEFSFWGRSNVGKSSFINALCDRKSLAKVSSTPGKTQHFNHFIIDQQWQIMDLPGYGFAAVSKKIKDKWGLEIKKYLMDRPNLLVCFLLLDITLAPQEIDLATMAWMGAQKIPFAIIFTKADKLSKSQLSQQLVNYKSTLEKDWEALPSMFVTSSKNRQGLSELRLYIQSLIT